MSVLKKQIAEVNGEANMFLWECRPDILIDGKLRAEAHRVVAENPECRRTQKDLVGLRIRDEGVRLKEPV